MDTDPLLEFRACVNDHIKGFTAKLNSGNVAKWGRNDGHVTEWVLLGAAVIGFYRKDKKNLSVIMGDRCRPKYFGARKLAVKYGENRTVTFFW